MIAFVLCYKIIDYLDEKIKKIKKKKTLKKSCEYV